MAIAQGDHRPDAVIVNQPLESIERQLRAAVENAFFDDVEVSQLGVAEVGIAPWSGDQHGAQEESEQNLKTARHGEASVLRAAQAPRFAAGVYRIAKESGSRNRKALQSCVLRATIANSFGAIISIRFVEKT